MYSILEERKNARLCEQAMDEEDTVKQCQPVSYASAYLCVAAVHSIGLGKERSLITRI